MRSSARVRQPCSTGAQHGQGIRAAPQRGLSRSAGGGAGAHGSHEEHVRVVPSARACDSLETNGVIAKMVNDGGEAHGLFDIVVRKYLLAYETVPAQMLNMY